MTNTRLLTLGHYPIWNSFTFNGFVKKGVPIVKSILCSKYYSDKIKLPTDFEFIKVSRQRVRCEIVISKNSFISEAFIININIHFSFGGKFQICKYWAVLSENYFDYWTHWFDSRLMKRLISVFIGYWHHTFKNVIFFQVSYFK